MPPQPLLVSVVIPAFRRPEKLRLAVRSALQQDLPAGQYEVIVVDSSPDDENERIVSALQSEARCSLRCLRKIPEGPGASRNLGARQGRGPFLAFLDSDCQAAPHWLREGLAAFRDGVGLVQGRVLPTPGVPHSILSWELRIESESFLYETANIFYRREAFEQVGGFVGHDLHAHSETPVGGEDTDLAWRVKRAGWQSRFAAEALVYHEVVTIPLRRWFYQKKIFMCPALVKRFPELRRYFYARYFFDRVHACLALALAGAALAAASPFALVLVLPYMIARGSERSKTLWGPLRLVRWVFYLPRDVVWMVTLIAGSIRYRSLLL